VQTAAGNVRLAVGPQDDDLWSLRVEDGPQPAWIEPQHRRAWRVHVIPHQEAES